MNFGKYEKPAARPQERPSRNKYRFFVRVLDNSKKEEYPLLRKEILESYKSGDLTKSEYLALLRNLQRRESAKKREKKKKKQVISTKSKKKEKEEELQEAKEINPYFGNVYSESEEKKEEKRETKEMASPKPGFFSKILSNSNFRLGAFVVVAFILLFMVTKNALAGHGDGDLLIFAIVLVGILLIVGSSGSKKEGDFF